METAAVAGTNRLQKKGRKFPLSWNTKYGSWLRNDAGQDLMFCKLCVSAGKEGPWVRGTDNFRAKTIEKHLASSDHKEAVAAKAPGQQILPSLFTGSQLPRNKAIESALRTV